MCAYELGVSMDTIKIKMESTLANANSQATGGSVTSELCCLVSYNHWWGGATLPVYCVVWRVTTTGGQHYQ